MRRYTVAAATALALVCRRRRSVRNCRRGTRCAADTHSESGVQRIRRRLAQGSTPASPQEAFQALRADDPFYREPPLTGTEKPGTVLKAEKVDVMFTGVKPANLDAWKLMYVTTERDGGTPAISTGILMIPRDGKPAHEKHVVSYQEANDSVGWNCHPSTQWTGGDPLDGASWSALGPLALMFGKGYAVMISDVGNDADRARTASSPVSTPRTLSSTAPARR